MPLMNAVQTNERISHISLDNATLIKYEELIYTWEDKGIGNPNSMGLLMYFQEGNGNIEFAKGLEVAGRNALKKYTKFPNKMTAHTLLKDPILILQIFTPAINLSFYSYYSLIWYVVVYGIRKANCYINKLNSVLSWIFI